MADQKIQYILTAVDRTQSAFSSVRNGLGTLGRSVSSFSGAFAALGAVGSIAGLATALRGAVDELAALDDAAESTGASVESLSSLLNTLAPTGVGLDQITDLAGKLTKSMVAADNSASKAAQAFKALGVDTRDSVGNLRSVDDVLVDVAKALAQYEDGTGKAALAQALLEESGARYLPLLKDLATQQRQASTVTGESAAKAEAFANQLRAVSRAAELFKQDLAQAILGPLSEVIERFNAAGTSSENFYNRLRLAFQPDKEISRLRGNVQALEKELQDLSKLQVLPEFDSDRLAQIETVTKRLEQARRALADAQPVIALMDPAAGLGEMNAAPGRTPLRRTPQLAGGSGPAKSPAASEAQRLLESLTDQVRKTEDLTQAEEILDRIRRGAIEGLTPALRDQIIAQATLLDFSRDAEKARKAEKDATDALKKSIDDLSAAEEIENRTKADALDPERVRQTDLQIRAWKEYKALVAGSVLEQQKLTQAISDVIGAQLELGNITPQTAEALRNQLLNTQKATKETDDRFKDLGLTFSSAFEDAVVNGRKLSDVLKGIGDDLVRLVVRRAITEPISRGISGLLSSIIPGRASGGPVSAGRPYMVGEVGKELFVPRTSGYIVPNNGLGGVTVNQTVNVGSGVNRTEVAQAMYAAKEAAKAEILASMRRGSTFAAA